MKPKSSKSPRVSIVVFIDALGWEVLRDRQFLEEELPFRRKLRSVFGFSSACVPSILSGLMPKEHKHWSFYYYAPHTSPFKKLSYLSVLPDSIAKKGRVRHLLSKIVKRFYNYTGYFQLYSMPFKHIGKFDYCEKKDLFLPGGLNSGQNIFDHLEKAEVDYHVSDWRADEESNMQSACEDLNQGKISFAFLYFAAMDALLHQVGKESPDVDKKLLSYEERLRRILDVAAEQYDEVRLFVCSDHGMATVHTELNLMQKIEALDLHFGDDYVATYDSTMGRFWFHNDEARDKITALLHSIPEGRVLAEEELKRLGCDFEHHQYGEVIYLTNPGVLVVPSHMGEKAITGMHGYHPDDADSDASLLSNVLPSEDITCIADIFHLMRSESGA